jgi:hypothetical protein
LWCLVFPLYGIMLSIMRLYVDWTGTTRSGLDLRPLKQTARSASKSCILAVVLLTVVGAPVMLRRDIADPTSA